MRSFCVVSFSVVIAFIVIPASARVPHCKNCFKVLNTDIKNAAKKSMTAVVQAGLDLTQMRDEFADKQLSLDSNLKQAKKMVQVLNAKLKESVEAVTKILEGATKKAKEKMAEVTAAADALGALESKVDVKEMKDKAKKIRGHIAKGEPIKSKVEKEVINENGVIAKLDAAKILAKDKAEKTEKKIEKTKASVRSDIARLQSEMSLAETNLENEEEQEIEDERDARNKIQEAVKHNQAALVKAKAFILSIEKGIEKFHKDIKEVPLS